MNVTGKCVCRLLNPAWGREVNQNMSVAHQSFPVGSHTLDPLREPVRVRCHPGRTEDDAPLGSKREWLGFSHDVEGQRRTEDDRSMRRHTAAVYSLPPLKAIPHRQAIGNPVQHGSAREVVPARWKANGRDAQFPRRLHVTRQGTSAEKRRGDQDIGFVDAKKLDDTR